MKIRSKLLKSIPLICGAFVATAAFGQTARQWTGTANGTNLATAGNWAGNTLPSALAGDTGLFDGSAPGNLVLQYENGLGGNAGEAGIDWQMSASQTGSVTITTPTVGTSGNLAVQDITIDSGAGTFALGSTDSTRVLSIIGRPNGALHTFANNSANTAYLNPYMTWKGGGGADFTLAFSGNWSVSNYCVMDNGPAIGIQVDSGTMVWTPTGFLGPNNLRNPAITINAGLLVLKGPHPRLGGQGIVNNSVLRFDAPSLSQTYSGVISGIGSLEVTNGTLTLSGQSTFGGNMVLGGGTVVVNGVENGFSGPLGVGLISFLGGSLTFSPINNYDYSSRFDPLPGQQYKIDTAGQNVTFATDLSSFGGTLNKLGSGALTLTAVNTYSGLTTVSAGKLIFQNEKVGNANIVVADGATLGVSEFNGPPIAPNTLTLGTSSGAILEFLNVTNTSTAPIAAGTISSAGPITINISGGNFNTIGQVFPLFSWSSGSAPAVTLGSVSGAAAHLETNGNTIRLVIDVTPYGWVGGSSGAWDLSATGNWKQSGSPAVYVNGAITLFDDSATGETNVTIGASLLPQSVTVNNSLLTYSITSSGANKIGGTGGLTKIGNLSLTLAGGVNDYTGATTVANGILSVGTLANGGVPSDIGASGNGASNLLINGGALEYRGAGASVDRLFSAGTANATLTASGTGALALTNTGSMGLSGNGARTLNLGGTNTDANTLAARVADSLVGATALTKNGTGRWVLTGTNAYSGVTTIAGGTLQIGAGGASGTLGTGAVVNNGQLAFNRSGTNTYSGVISGGGSVRVTNGASDLIILTGTNTYSGNTVIDAGGRLQIGNGGGGGINPNTTITDNGTLIFNTTSPITLNAPIGGSGNVWVRSTGLIKALGAKTYTGWTTIDAGATYQPAEGNTGRLVSSVVTNNGTLLFTWQELNPTSFAYTNSIVGTGRVVKENNNQNAGWIMLIGTNTYTGGTWIRGGVIQLGDGVTPGGGQIVGPVIFTNTSTAFLNNRSLVFSRFDAFTFTNDISSSVTDGSAVADRGALQQLGPGDVTLTGNISYPGNTTIAAGMTMQFGNGGTGGAIGTGAVVNDGRLIINRSAATTITNGVSGAGELVKLGSGTLTLSGAGTYTGNTTVSNGALMINAANASAAFNVVGGTLGGTGVLSGPVTVNSGAKLAPGTSVGTLTINNTLTINGDIAIELNKSLAQSNDLVVVSSTLVNSGTGVVLVTNLGPALAVNDKFTLFSQPVFGGGTLTIVPPAGVTFTNLLEVDGSIMVLTAAPPAGPTNITYSVSGNQLTVSWPGSHLGWTLQTQTNTLATGIRTNWFDIPGSSSSTQQVITVSPANPTVFFRLRSP